MMKWFKLLVIIVILFLFSAIVLSCKHTELTAEGMKVKKYLGINQLSSRYSGQGVTIAVLDSGLAPTQFINDFRVIKFKDFVNRKENIYDDYGHGTSIVSIIGANGDFRGIAPDVNFVILKVLDKFGQSDRQTLTESLTWIIENAEKYNIDILNISFGIVSSIDIDEDPIYSLIAEINKKGVIIICSAGNKGPTEDSILTPGKSKDVITVGSTKSNQTYNVTDDVVTEFSSRGSVEINKPDIVTLGVDITSIGMEGELLQKSGTSYSTAIVSGVAALLKEKYHNQNTEYIKSLILKSTKHISVPNGYQGNKNLYFDSLR